MKRQSVTRHATIHDAGFRIVGPFLSSPLPSPLPSNTGIIVWRFRSVGFSLVSDAHVRATPLVIISHSGSGTQVLLEIAGLQPHLMRDVPSLQYKAALVSYAYHTYQSMPRKLRKLLSHPLPVSFLFFLSRLLFSFRFTSSSSLSFLQLNTINHDLHLCIIRTQCVSIQAIPLRCVKP